MPSAAPRGATRQRRVGMHDAAREGRTGALYDARHVQHVVLVDDDAYAVRGVRPELSKLAHEAAHYGRGYGLLRCVFCEFTAARKVPRAYHGRM